MAETGQERDPSGRQVASAVDNVRVCDDCERPLLAEDGQEYTEQRGRLVAERGLCVCRPAGRRRQRLNAKAGAATTAKPST